MTLLDRSSFDEKKAAEVAFFFLCKARAREMTVTKLRLVKWIYLAERLSYARHGEPMIGDQLFSMMHGPVPSKTLYLIEHPDRVTHRTHDWEAVVAVRKDGHHRHQYLSVAESCPYRTSDDLLALSLDEVDLLEEVWTEHGVTSAKGLEEKLHNQRNFPEWEWQPERGGARPIHLERLFDVLKVEPEVAKRLIKRARAFGEVDRAFEVHASDGRGAVH